LEILNTSSRVISHTQPATISLSYYIALPDFKLQKESLAELMLILVTIKIRTKKTVHTN
jgi:hypothetical protein